VQNHISKREYYAGGGGAVAAADLMSAFITFTICGKTCGLTLSACAIVIATRGSADLIVYSCLCVHVIWGERERERERGGEGGRGVSKLRAAGSVGRTVYNCAGVKNGKKGK
jgi:hypothetical protein